MKPLLCRTFCAVLALQCLFGCAYAPPPDMTSVSETPQSIGAIDISDTSQFSEAVGISDVSTGSDPSCTLSVPAVSSSEAPAVPSSEATVVSSSAVLSEERRVAIELNSFHGYWEPLHLEGEKRDFVLKTLDELSPEIVESPPGAESISITVYLQDSEKHYGMAQGTLVKPEEFYRTHQWLQAPEETYETLRSWLKAAYPDIPGP